MRDMNSEMPMQHVAVRGSLDRTEQSDVSRPGSTRPVEQTTRWRNPASVGIKLIHPSPKCGGGTEDNVRVKPRVAIPPALKAHHLRKRRSLATALRGG